MPYPTHLIPTTVVGSYPQPDWLIDRAALEKHGVPRIHAPEIWRIAPEHLTEAQNDATILAIEEMERIGIDIVSDGEIRRESYSNYFSLTLEGIDSEQLGAVIGANGRSTPVARVTGKIRRKGPIEIDDAAFLVRHARRATKITLPWPEMYVQDAIQLMGDDFWRYGVAENAKDIETLARYSFEQGLATRHLSAEEIFHPSVFEISKV